MVISQFCQIIVENVDDKNPKDNDGWTPLHLAAENGHLSICQLIIKNVDEKNPKDDFGETPLKLATSRHHLDIKNLVENAIECISANSKQVSIAKKLKMA